MKQKLAVALLAMTIIVGGFSPALAHDHAKKEETKAEMKADFFKHINATPDQKKKIEALDTQYKAKIDPLEKQMWDKKKSLMSYVCMPNSKKEEALKQEGEVVDLKSQIGQLYIEQAYTQKSYLTPEQQQKASEFYSEKMKEHEGHDD